MSKTLLYRLFGLGKIPRDAIDQIEKEGIVLQDEGLSGSVTFQRFRAPGKYYGWRRNWFSGSVVLTQEHFLAFQYSRPIIGVSWSDEKIKKLEVRLENENTLFVGFEASTFQAEASGDIEIRMSTPLAEDLSKHIECKIAEIQL